MRIVKVIAQVVFKDYGSAKSWLVALKAISGLALKFLPLFFIFALVTHANETLTSETGILAQPELQIGPEAVDEIERSARVVQLEARIKTLTQPMYSPLIERYLMDEVKSIRTDMQAIRAELIEKVVDKELLVADKSMSYATSTITYFFYLIAGISTLLVLLGWNSIRDIQQRMRDFAENEVARIAEKYESRLQKIEEELSKKSRKIYQNQKEIDRTNELHSLWLKASQETIPQNKISVYDQILALRPDDIEALTYKADAALQLGEATWAISLCNRALEQDENNSHAYYQRACAYAETECVFEALRDLERAVSISEAFREAASKDVSFRKIMNDENFVKLTHQKKEV